MLDEQPPAAPPPPTPPRSPYLDIDEAAVYLKIASRDVLRAMVHRHRIPHRRSGRRFIFLPRELDKWLERWTARQEKRRKKSERTRARRTAKRR